MAKRVEPEDLTAYAFLSEPSLAPDASFAVLSVHRALLEKDEYEGHAWAPDGRRVLFLSNVGQDDEDVRTIRRINFWFNEKGFIYNLRKHVFELDIETKEPKQITKGELDVTKAAWSHDGHRIAYVAQTDDRRPYLQHLFGP